MKIKDLSKSSIIITIGMKWGMFMDCKNSILSTETDPVCKMQVDKRKAKFTSEIKERHTISALFSVRRNSMKNYRITELCRYL